MFTTRRLVEFRDTDAAGIMHFTAFFGYMESAEHEFLRSLGRSVVAYDDAGKVSWPRVSAHCDYVGAIRFEEELEISVSIGRLGNKSVTYRFDFCCGDREIAHGEVTSVCCRMTAEGPQSMAIPSDLADLLKPHVAPS